MSEQEIYKILTFVLCYIIGSFPTAYLIVKRKLNKDITKEGSGNVGTLNVMTVTKSKRLGILVLVIDLLKGALPLYLMLYVLNLNYSWACAGALTLVIGHNFPVWLKFKGGRGLATGAGIYLVLSYFVLIGWCVSWLVIFAVKKKVLLANTFATLTIPLYVYLINEFDWMMAGIPYLKYFNLISILITIVILSRHTEVFSKLIFKQND